MVKTIGTLIRWQHNTNYDVSPLSFFNKIYCRFQVTFQRAVAKFVANLPITFPSSEIGANFATKLASSFQCLNHIIMMFISINPLLVQKKKTINDNYWPYSLIGFTNGNSICDVTLSVHPHRAS
jgi:hypothetical protein